MTVRILLDNTDSSRESRNGEVKLIPQSAGDFEFYYLKDYGPYIYESSHKKTAVLFLNNLYKYFV